MCFPILALFFISSYYVEANPQEMRTGSVKWRIFNGKDFPENSLEVGFENDNKVYVGLNKVAGKVIENRLLLEYVKDHQYASEDRNFWILTHDQSVKLEWVLVSSEDPSVPSDVEPIPIGQPGEKYITLAGTKGNHTVGTLYCNDYPADCDPMFAINRYGNVQRYQTFKILVYRREYTEKK